MPVIVSVGMDLVSGWSRVRFPFSRTAIDTIKAIPGARWNPDTKTWLLPIDGVAALQQRALTTDAIKIDWNGIAARPVKIPDDAQSRLNPFQIEGATFLAARGGALLTFAPRLGKTATSLTAARSLFDQRLMDAVIVVYPNGVRHEWQRQTPLWWPGQSMVSIVTQRQRDDQYEARMKAALASPCPIIGIHYDILEPQIEYVRDLLKTRRYVLIADEIHLAKNRKAPRTQALWALREKAVAGWGLTGTPMRNRPRDLYALFEYTIPQSCGMGYWKWAGVYANAHVDDSGHWDDMGESNPEELRTRLSAISFRKTREEVAAFLPKADRVVVKCSFQKEDRAKYDRVEKALANQIGKALLTDEPSAAQRSVIDALTNITTKAKVPAAIERAIYYCSQGLTPIIFCHHHATLDAIEKEWTDGFASFDPEVQALKPFWARGADLPNKRHLVLQEWKKQPRGTSVLIANTLSVNVGIDLSEGDVGIFTEFEWVPADFRQAEDRLVDVHLGKRIAPPIYEYLAVERTVDEDMAVALLNKVRSIEKIVGGERDMSQMAGAIRDSGVAGAYVGLASTDKETVQSALLAARDRWLSGVADKGDAVVADVAGTDWDEEEKKDEDDIPF